MSGVLCGSWWVWDSGCSELNSNNDNGFSFVSLSRRWKGVEYVSMLASWDTLKIFNGKCGWRRCDKEPLTVKGSNCRPTNNLGFGKCPWDLK